MGIRTDHRESPAAAGAAGSQRIRAFIAEAAIVLAGGLVFFLMAATFGVPGTKTREPAEARETADRPTSGSSWQGVFSLAFPGTDASDSDDAHPTPGALR